MSELDPIHMRGKALEDEFFHRVDGQLKQKLRDSMEHDKALEALKLATGIEDEALLEHLLEAGFRSTTLAALGLVPIIFVAWADGRVSPEERQTVMGEALRRGLEVQPQAFHLVEGWLKHKPPKSLWEVWTGYLHAVLDASSPEMADRLRSSVLEQANAVANASAGFFGLNRVGKEEREVIQQIEDAFSVT